jgi:hypothetical protein
MVAPANNSRASTWFARHRGFFRHEMGGARHVLPARDWNRVVGFNRRSFTANLLDNDTTARELLLRVEDPRATKSTRMVYEVIIPYSSLMRVAILVVQARTFETIADEEKFRRKYRRSIVNKQYFDPKDRFEAVELI